MISVIITITDGDWHLERCIEAILSQPCSQNLQIVVPYISGRDPIEPAQARFPSVQFVKMAWTGDSVAGAGLDHWTYDLRRAAGLRFAAGDILAMTEDHAIPAPDWLATIEELHQTLPHSAIGGSIDHVPRSLLNWAVYIIDFGRYQSPLKEGPAEYVSDINVSYKRAALEKVCDCWAEYYHETYVHARMRSSGDTIWLSPRLRVSHDRGSLPLARLFRERIAWARLFAARRALAAGLVARLALVMMAPALPLVLYVRRVRELTSKGVARNSVWTVTPLLVLLLILSAFGEFIGYATGRAVAVGVRLPDQALESDS